MSGQAMTNTLNYASLKRKAVSARSMRINQTSKSGTTFGPGQSFSIALPTASRQYADLQNCYLQFKVYFPTGTAANNQGHFDTNAYSLFDRCTTTAAGGSVIEDITGLAKYYQAVLSETTSLNNHQNVFLQTLGGGGDPNYKFIGVAPGVGANNGIVVTLPLFHGIFSCEKMIPLDTASPIEFQFYLAATADAFFRATANAVADYTVDSPTLIVPVVEISPDAQALLDQSVSGLGYNINFTGVAHSQDVRPANQTSVITNLPFRYSSLERVMCLHYNQGTKSDADFSQSNRSTGAMRSFSLKVGGSRIPQIPITLDPKNMGQVMSEMLLSNNVLGDMFHQTNLNLTRKKLISNDDIGAAHAQAEIVGALNIVGSGPTQNQANYQIENGLMATATNVAGLQPQMIDEYGQFIVALSLETFKNPVETGGIYSGLSTIGSTVQSNIDYAVQNVSMDIHYYATYSAVLSLDPMTRTWAVSN